jgi:hypothetical protein
MRHLPKVARHGQVVDLSRVPSGLGRAAADPLGEDAHGVLYLLLVADPQPQSAGRALLRKLPSAAGLSARLSETGCVGRAPVRCKGRQ